MSYGVPLDRIDWVGWDAIIRERGITIDRPRGATHPDWPEIVYPIDYGFINGTKASDGHEVDIFVGTAETGLVAAVFTRDHRKRDRECKFLVDCTPEEIYLVNGFLNFDRMLMDGALVMRWPMHELRAKMSF